MAYTVYYECDKCGKLGGAWRNYSVSLSVCTRIARSEGWKIGKRGWICPNCQAKKTPGKK